ncbi:MAG: hypothetical protein EPN93_13650 [Spirochaetes bacterium]|nr:MAG: hypothetical protein EPN93_13650 [Spirochaetota bacterium]
MILKRKLSLGLGFLFIIIFALTIFCSYYVQKVARDSDNILKNNYDTLVFSKKMLLAAEDMKTAAQWVVFNPNKNNNAANFYLKLFEAARKDFELNKKAENNNITEIHEDEYVDSLNRNYEVFAGLCAQMKDGRGNNAMYFNELLPAHEKLRTAIVSINDINMQAIVRKNELTRADSRSILISMSVIGTMCLLLAFGYLWYFPFYISNSIEYVSKKMKDLLKTVGITPENEPNDELFLLLQSMDLIEKKFMKPVKKKR